LKGLLKLPGFPKKYPEASEHRLVFSYIDIHKHTHTCIKHRHRKKQLYVYTNIYICYIPMHIRGRIGHSCVNLNPLSDASGLRPECSFMVVMALQADACLSGWRTRERQC
jgi:hypothetical protein